MVHISHIVVREATVADATAMVEVYRANVRAAGVDSSRADIGPGMWRDPEPGEAEAAVGENLGDETRRIWVAVSEDTVVGFISAVRRTITSVHQTHAVVMNELEIHPDARGKGVSKKLLSALQMWAEETGSDLIVTISGSQDRDKNRFFAKLGFGQVGVARALPTDLLRSRLNAKTAVSRDTNKLITLRRTLRNRQARAGSR